MRRSPLHSLIGSRGIRTPRVTRLTAALAVGSLSTLALTACGSSGGSGGGQSVTVAIPPTLSGTDVYVAQQQGFFDKRHLKVSVKVLNGGAAIVPAMEGGSVDIGETNVVSVLQSADKNIKEPCFTGANTDPTKGHYNGLVASSASHITDAAGLKGKTVAVNATKGINQLLVRKYLDRRGVPSSSVHFIALQFADMPQALKSGRVDAALTSEPFTTSSLNDGNRLLAGTPLPSVPGTPTFSCWNASATWLSKHHKAAADFAAAMRETDAWITAHQDEFRKIASQHLSIPEATLKKITLPVFTAELSQRDIDAWQTAAATYGLLSGEPKRTDVFSPVGASGR